MNREFLLKWFSLATVLECAVTIYCMVLISRDPKNVFLFGLSLPRLIVVSSLCIVAACLVIFSLGLVRKCQWASNLAHWIFKAVESKSIRHVGLSTFFILFVAGLVFLWMLPGIAQEKRAMGERLTPLVIFITLFSAQTILFCSKYLHELSGSVGFQLAILWIGVFASRIPFINAGFGNDLDTWRVIFSGKILAETGLYQASRLPGYPIPEIAAALFWKSPYVFYNGISALMSAFSAIFLALIVRHYGSREHWLVAAAFAFIPAVYTNSTNGMDYMWALAFLLAAFYFMLKGKVVVSGFVIGLATGCRLTSILMVIPLLMIFFSRFRITGNGFSHNRNKYVESFFFSVTVMLTVSLVYLPVFTRYGIDFLHFTDSQQSLEAVIFLAGENLWSAAGLGILATSILAGMLVSIFSHRTYSTSISQRNAPRLHVFAWSMAIALILFLFLRLPLETGYLIPIIPFIFLLLARFMERRILRLTCFLFLFVPFLSFYDLSPSPGPIFADQSRRLGALEEITRLYDQERELTPSGSLVIITGPEYPRLALIKERSPAYQNRSNLILVQSLTHQEIVNYAISGKIIYNFPAREWITQNH